jgi:hypothetical protein
MLRSQPEAAGEAAFVDFAVAELASLLGSDFARRVKPLGLHRWGSDPFARGSYSYALPSQAACRGAPLEAFTPLKARQSLKIQEIAAGFVTLDKQAKALGVPRSTAWTIVAALHKKSGLSPKLVVWLQPS